MSAILEKLLKSVETSSDKKEFFDFDRYFGIAIRELTTVIEETKNNALKNYLEKIRDYLHEEWTNHIEAVVLLMPYSKKLTHKHEEIYNHIESKRHETVIKIPQLMGIDGVGFID